ncbi:MAG TPA: BTAD domain-containing putative transcriptional regulator [Chloroflexota bacterium]|nr:BTAD domain-containing putative transcriptional regulator [Chloroflexota bacterium]
MLKFHLLGRPQINLGDQPVTDFASEKELLLLCYLACNPGEYSRPQLAGLLWGEMREERARANLSTAVYNLHQLLPTAIQVTRKTAVFNPTQPVWLDTAVLQQALNEDAENLEAAVARYRGPFLEGIYPQDAPELETWLQQERERWRLLALTALDRLAQQQSQGGEWEKAITTLRRLLDLEPWREESHRVLMRLLARTGQFNAALVQYETCRTLLEQELGVEPMAETTAVYHRIQTARQRPQTHHLPPQPTPLVGRAAELGRLFVWFNDPSRRLITLAGPGGSGKTRLALAAAGDQAYAFLDGVHFVPLVEVTNHAGLVQAIATALGLTLTAGEEQPQLLDYLRHKEMLLLLDNVEQALAPTADLVLTLLENASRLRLIVTSREYLQLRWETRLSLGGLPVPPDAAADMAAFDAVRLFVQVGQRVCPDFNLTGQETAVADLCRLVEGIPLALELAASLLNAEAPPQLLAQIRQSFDRLATTMHDVPARHRSLRAVFDYSWALLAAAQQAALPRLALFHGGFTPQAALAVAAASPVLLAGLAAKSLIHTEANGRYSLHELIRHYALERLADVPPATAAHAAYFAAQLQQAAQTLHGSAQTAVAHQLLADLANIEVGWQTGIAAADEDLLRAMAPGLARFYVVAGLFQAGEAAFGAALVSLATPALQVYHAMFLLERQEYEAAATAVAAASAGLSDPVLVAQAYLITAATSLRQGDVAAAHGALTQALATAEKAQIPWLEAQAWRLFGQVSERTGAYAQAEEALRQALAIYETSGDPLELARTYQSLAAVLFRRGDNVGSKQLLEKALAIQRQVDPTGLSSARVLVALGTVASNLNQEEQAVAFFQQSLAVFRQMGDRANAALAANMLGRGAAWDYDFSRARNYYTQALAWYGEIGQRKGVADTQRYLADLALTLGQYEEAQARLTAVLDTYHAIQDKRSVGTTLTRLSLLHHLQGDEQTAAQQAEAALAIAAEIGNPLLRAYGLSCLGHAWRGKKLWDRATAVYGDAINLWQELDMTGLQAENQAALATVHHAAGRPDNAWSLLETAVAHLVANPQPDCDTPGQLYLDCVLLLQAKGDEAQAAHLWRQAIAVIRRQADGIDEVQSRLAFLTGIQVHQRLFTLDLAHNPQ